MTTLFDSAAPVKSARRTARPFAAGLTRFVPFAVTAPGYVEPSDEDRAAVGQLFADYEAECEPEPDWDTLAGEAAYVDWAGSLSNPAS